MTRTQALYRQKQRRKKKADRIQKFFFLCVVVLGLIIYIDFVRFPECYLTTWKYQLKNEIAAGDEEAITYYNNYYVKYNRNLFDN